MDALFYLLTDTPSYKRGVSIVFLTTNLERIAKTQQSEDMDKATDPIFVAIGVERGERVGRGQILKSCWRYWGPRRSHSG
jgi:hypothetical protein